VAIVRNSSFGAVGTYRIPNFKWTSYGVYTNHTPSAAYRGFGSPEVQWAVEQQMDIIAERLGFDPIELRKTNLLKEGDRNAQGQITESIGAEASLTKVAEGLEWGKQPDESIGPWKRGNGIAIGNKYIPAAITSCAHVKVHPDKVLEVRHSLDEEGQGITTVAAQIVAEEFGVSVADIRVVWGDTAFMPWDWASIGSRSTWTLGNALLRACQDAKRQIFQLTAPKLGVNSDDLETSDWQVFARGFPGKVIQITDLFSPLGFIPGVGELMGKGEYTCPKTPEDEETGQAERAAACYMHGAYGVTVSVNVETGEVRLESITGCFDMGQPINPKMCEQQIEGGIGQGIGPMFYEEMVEDNGAVVNTDFADYKVPTAVEMPDNQNLNCMIEAVPHIEGPFGAKGLGEGVLVALAPALANAVYNATGVRIKEMPLTRERVWRALARVKAEQTLET
jgi:CO/xanthine dehydrogenase Mo-binding subunit